MTKIIHNHVTWNEVRHWSENLSLLLTASWLLQSLTPTQVRRHNWQNIQTIRINQNIGCVMPIDTIITLILSLQTLEPTVCALLFVYVCVLCWINTEFCTITYCYDLSNQNRRQRLQRKASFCTVPMDEMCRKLFSLSLSYCIAD